jgi:hypothetical protein
MIFWLALNLAAFSINASGIIPNYSQEPSYDPTSIASTFNITTLLALGAGIGIGGLVAIVTKQNIWSIGAILVWSLGVLIPLVRDFFLGVPLMFVRLGVPWYVTTSLGALIAFTYFFFFVGVVTQRDYQ